MLLNLIVISLSLVHRVESGGLEDDLIQDVDVVHRRTVIRRLAESKQRRKQGENENCYMRKLLK
jgi:hypothetical protein